MEEFSGLLDFVRITSGTSFRSCEPEIIELMRQIDSMIEEKMTEWQQQMLSIEKELQIKVDENLQLSKSLESCRKEVKVLKKQLANEKKHNNSLLMQYDTEVKKLRDELNKLKSKYKKHPKKTKESPKKTNNLDDKEKPKESPSQIDNNNPDDLSKKKRIHHLEKSLIDLNNCLQDANKTLDTRVEELQLCHVQLEAAYFDNSLLRNFLRQESILDMPSGMGMPASDIVDNFNEKEKQRELLLEQKLRSRVEEFVRNTTVS